MVRERGSNKPKVVSSTLIESTVKVSGNFFHFLPFFYIPYLVLLHYIPYSLYLPVHFILSRFSYNTVLSNTFGLLMRIFSDYRSSRQSMQRVLEYLFPLVSFFCNNSDSVIQPSSLHHSQFENISLAQLVRWFESVGLINPRSWVRPSSRVL
jgi:hypothetical protein